MKHRLFLSVLYTKLNTPQGGGSHTVRTSITKNLIDDNNHFNYYCCYRLSIIIRIDDNIFAIDG